MRVNKATECAVDGCERPAAVRGWCRGHDQRVRRSGSPGPATFRRAPNSEPPVCLTPDCGEPAHARGFCRGHYQRWYDGRDTSAPVIKQVRRAEPQQCRIDGCSDIQRSRGLCNRHYQHWYRTGDPGPADLPRYGLVEMCSAEGCDRPHRTKGFCDTHYRRWRRGLSVDSVRFRSIPKRADVITYNAAHQQLRSLRGPASRQQCECGETARQWAYQHNDPEALTSPLGHKYSLRYFDCYAPMCQSCHNLLDRDLDEQLRRAALTRN